MATEIGDEYSSTAIKVKHFEKLADEARLLKPQVRRRVPEMADSILSALSRLTTEHPTVRGVAKIITENCERAINRFKAPSP